MESEEILEAFILENENILDKEQKKIIKKYPQLLENLISFTEGTLTKSKR